ncbi:MAG: tRNA (N6-isopentenyl adenosine(37)-C2)-methylthiotransferase MiaB [Candidatus Omnitrophica bacterium]|nr:tRNA (N6-isopentenyl adenosine(37)-C2)-methylthiotransferase MiaB [Candidatus Omnitrophota bacterium]
MNLYDTEVAEGLLAGQGFEVVPDALTSSANALDIKVNADVFLMNTCSVREHAEERVWGRMGMLRVAKETNPDLIVGMMGCMVEEHREKLFKRFPQLDLMVGTRNIKELPALIEEVRKNRNQVARIKQDGISIEYTDQILRKGKFHAWLPIMTGCNKVCTFCIVPITRGSEVSMQAREVYREASRLVSEGVKWITLLGQNVNSYDGFSGVEMMPGASGAGAARKTDSEFPQLLDMLCGIEGLERISFTTSHPSDATEELYRVIAKNPKVSRRFHLPLQAGSDRVLKRMKRLHTYAEYREKIRLMRELIPDISVTTDIISGFSGETDEDHQETAKALEEIRFDGAFIYKYSLRPGTPAAKLPDDVPLLVKERRNAELLGIQKQITTDADQRLVGRTVEVFVEDVNVRNPKQLFGRTQDEKRIVFDGEDGALGQFKKVRVERLSGETLLGALL